jgi:SPP1 gp7 family putative phage head morphogenesis protein
MERPHEPLSSDRSDDALISAANYLKAWLYLNGAPVPLDMASRLEAAKARTKYLPDPHAHIKLQAERHLATALTGYLSSLQDRIAAWAERRKGAKAIPAEFWEEEDQTLLAILGPQLNRMAYSGASIAAEKAGIAFDTSMANKAAADWADEYTDTLLQQLGTTTQDGIGPIVEDWINTDGATMGDLFQSLMDTGLMGADRASLIATTETTRAFAQGEIKQYSAMGITRMRWQTNNDEVVCPICADLNGQIATIGESFGDNEQGDPIYAPPDAHPGDRCWITPVVGEKHVKVIAEGTDAGGWFWVNPDNVQSKPPYIRMYGASADVTVYVVDGRYIRDNIFIDFVAGGNDQVYGGDDPDKPTFIPAGEIWLENSNPDEFSFVLLHELTERNHMQAGEDYDTAHDAANMQEQAAREDPEKLPELLKKQGWNDGE